MTSLISRGIDTRVREGPLCAVANSPIKEHLEDVLTVTRGEIEDVLVEGTNYYKGNGDGVHVINQSLRDLLAFVLDDLRKYVIAVQMVYTTKFGTGPKAWVAKLIKAIASTVESEEQQKAEGAM